MPPLPPLPLPPLDNDVETAWTEVYEAVTAYQAHMKDFYAALGRLLVVKEANPGETAILTVLQADVDARKAELPARHGELSRARAAFTGAVLKAAARPRNGGSRVS